MKNNYEVRGDVTAIFLNYKGTILETEIDTSDLIIASSIAGEWRAALVKSTSGFYVVSRNNIDGKRSVISLSRLIMNASQGNDIDHINHDTLNNKRLNLREITHGQNMQNKKGPFTNSKSGIRGVCWDKQNRKWHAQVKLQGKSLYSKLFKDIKEAEQAVIIARKQFLLYSTN